MAVHSECDKLHLTFRAKQRLRQCFGEILQPGGHGKAATAVSSTASYHQNFFSGYSHVSYFVILVQPGPACVGKASASLMLESIISSSSSKARLRNQSQAPNLRSSGPPDCVFLLTACQPVASAERPVGGSCLNRQSRLERNQTPLFQLSKEPGYEGAGVAQAGCFAGAEGPKADR